MIVTKSIFATKAKSDRMENPNVLNCSNVFIACYFNDDRGCTH